MMVRIEEVEARFDECWYCGHGLRAKPWIHSEGCPRFAPRRQLKSGAQAFMGRYLIPADETPSMSLVIPLAPVLAMESIGELDEQAPTIQTVTVHKRRVKDDEAGTWWWAWDLLRA